MPTLTQPSWRSKQPPLVHSQEGDHLAKLGQLFRGSGGKLQGKKTRAPDSTNFECHFFAAASYFSSSSPVDGRFPVTGDSSDDRRSVTIDVEQHSWRLCCSGGHSTTRRLLLSPQQPADTASQPADEELGRPEPAASAHPLDRSNLFCRPWRGNRAAAGRAVCQVRARVVW